MYVGFARTYFKCQCLPLILVFCQIYDQKPKKKKKLQHFFIHSNYANISHTHQTKSLTSGSATPPEILESDQIGSCPSLSESKEVLF